MRHKRKNTIMDIVYKKISHAQQGKANMNFTINKKEIPVIENLLKDAEVKYKKEEASKDKIKYYLEKCEIKSIEDRIPIEYFDDEIPSPGEIF